MIKSMTGYGFSRHEESGVTITAEVKSLNSKFLDVLIKLPKEFSDKELNVKSLLSDKVVRGKITLTVDYIDTSAESGAQINQQALLNYFNQLKGTAEISEEELKGIIPALLQLPDVVGMQETELTEEEWLKVEGVILDAVKQCDDHRSDEGATLLPALTSNIQVIGERLELVGQEDPKRIESIKQRIGSNLRDHLADEKVDNNRFEQEVIYFLEKLDITEEKVRLKSHLDYFMEVLRADTSQGKKLGFIAQEIGREINTIGSKANHAPIQHLVVEMKEELEKIREQLLNIL